jgi:hypothetical protein
MAEILNDAEIRFLAQYSLSFEDIFDARGMPAMQWKRRIRVKGKTIALATACGRRGHCLRTRVKSA